MSIFLKEELRYIIEILYRQYLYFSKLSQNFSIKKLRKMSSDQNLRGQHWFLCNMEIGWKPQRSFYTSILWPSVIWFPLLNSLDTFNLVLFEERKSHMRCIWKFLALTEPLSCDSCSLSEPKRVPFWPRAPYSISETYATAQKFFLLNFSGLNIWMLF